MKRIGKFYVSRDLLWAPGNLLFEVLQAMQFVPTGVRFIYQINQYEYVGLSPLFRVLGAGEDAPIYDLTTDMDQDAKDAGKPWITVHAHVSSDAIAAALPVPLSGQAVDNPQN
jgi:hypothetical protein